MPFTSDSHQILSLYSNTSVIEAPCLILKFYHPSSKPFFSLIWEIGRFNSSKLCGGSQSILFQYPLSETGLNILPIKSLQHSLSWDRNSLLAIFSTRVTWKEGIAPDIQKTYLVLTKSLERLFQSLHQADRQMLCPVLLNENLFGMVQVSTDAADISSSSGCSVSTHNSGDVPSDKLIIHRQRREVIIPLTAASPCDSGPCQNNRTCIPGTNNTTPYYCLCSSKLNLTLIFNYTKLVETGWLGQNCTIDIDECRQSPCLNNGICRNTNGSFRCYCGQGNDGYFYSGLYCQERVDQCATTKTSLGLTELPLCKHGNCSNVLYAPYFACSCVPGWQGLSCNDDVDECAPRPCLNEATCTNLMNNYTCACAPGFKGIRCEINIDECLSSPCQNNGQCIDGVNNFTCDCSNTSYTGWNCSIPAVNTYCNRFSPCQNGGTCASLGESYNCSCYAGFGGKSCETDINECANSLCQPNVTCLQLSNRTLYDIKYRSLAPFTTPFNYSSAAGYYCDCPEGFRRGNCSTFCTSSPCLNLGICRENASVSSGFICSCLPGYSGKTCEENINDCGPVNPCQNNGTCIDQVNGYLCRCSYTDSVIWTGVNCTTPLYNCSAQSISFCLNGGQCRPQYNPYTGIITDICICPIDKGLGGLNCSQSTSMNFSLAAKSVLIIESSKQANFTPFLYSWRMSFKTVLSDAPLWLVHFTSVDLYLAVFVKSRGVFISSSTQKEMLLLSAGSLSYATNPPWNNLEVTFIYNGSQIWSSFRINFSSSTGSVVSMSVLIGNVSSDKTENITASNWIIYLGSLDSLNLTKFSIFQNNQSQQFISYGGCIRDSYINHPSQISINQRSNVTTMWIHPSSQLNFTKLSHISDCTNSRDDLCSTRCTSPGTETCLDLWDSAQCQCRRPYFDVDCGKELQPVTFGFDDQKSYAQIDMSSVDVQQGLSPGGWFNLSFFMITRSENQMLFYLGTTSSSTESATAYLTCSVEYDILTIRIRESSTMKVITFNDPTWRLTNAISRLLVINYQIPTLTTSANIFVSLRARLSNGSLDGGNQLSMQLSTILKTTPTNMTYPLFYIGGFDTLPKPSPQSVSLTRYRRDVNALSSVDVPSSAYSMNVSTFKGILQDPIFNTIPISLMNVSTLNIYQGISLKPLVAVELVAGAMNDPLCRRNTNTNQSTCLNGGNCSEIFYNQISCNCSFGWSGTNCGTRELCLPNNPCEPGQYCISLIDRYKCVGEVTFNGVSSRAIFVAQNIFSEQSFNVISFGVRTSATDGSLIQILANNTGDTLLSLRLIQSGVQISTKFIWILNVHIPILQDGAWHNVSIVLAPQFRVLVDGININQPSLYSQGLNGIGTIWLGSLPNATQFFKGCLRDVQLDDNFPLSFSSKSTNSSSLPGFVQSSQLTVDLTFKCSVNETCPAKTCLSNGTCMSNGSDFVCLCPSGYQGNRCQYQSCSNFICPIEYSCLSYCSNNNSTSQCLPDQLRYRCNCSTDRVGLQCEYLNLCLTRGIQIKYSDANSTSMRGNPCQNGASCTPMLQQLSVSISQSDYSCECGFSWTGKNCDQAVSNATSLIIGLCLGLLFLLFIIIGSSFGVRHVVQLRAQHGVYRPRTEETYSVDLTSKHPMRKPPEERLI